MEENKSIAIGNIDSAAELVSRGLVFCILARQVNRMGCTGNDYITARSWCQNI